MTSVEGTDIIGGGMEFPMLTLMGSYEGRGAFNLYSVTAHELAHMWVPMIVGTNEKRHAWMDEGATSFLENQTEPDYWPDIENQDSADFEAYLQLARVEMEESMMTHHDYYEPGPAGGIASYSKPASLMVTLRNLLGEEVFMEAYQSFIRDWAFKHPSPWDFFNTFERASGQDLDWFWNSWYYETWALDQAVESVRTDGNETVVTIADHGFAPMPAKVRITTREGRVLEREVPVTHWLSGELSAEIRIPASAGEVGRVEIDPDQHFPDKDRSNNVWERG
jgi:aminopeptidase N